MAIYRVLFGLIVLLVASVTASPTTLRDVGEYDSPSYIVKLKDHISVSQHLALLNGKIDDSSSVTHADWHPTIFHGFAGKFSQTTLAALRAHPEVEYVEKDGIVDAFAPITQSNAPWYLGRLDQNTRLSSTNTSAQNYAYTYDSSAGAGVDIYIVDTGINVNSPEFGGRARWGVTLGGYLSTDGNGHGTAIAAIAAGTHYGVAKLANLVAVKVLSDQGSGTVSDILGGSASTALDSAVTNVIAAGVHVAAGSSNTNAGSTSPARVPSAITVASSTISDVFAPFSDYGPIIDIIAPGVSITTIGADGVTPIVLSGNSCASAYVAGLVAYYIGRLGNTSPSALITGLQGWSIKGVLSGVPSGTVNYLTRNDENR